MSTTSPSRRVVHDGDEAVNQWKVASLFSFGIALRAAVSLHPYSGEKTPPMYGDYEAQRHWMEIAINLPPSQWYQNSTANDLAYWGLDYPPISGYASYAMGKLLRYIDAEAVRLHASRGYETSLSRAFMRATVLLADLVIFFPALFLLTSQLYSKRGAGLAPHLRHGAITALQFCITIPSLILIDHGHFQYNNISLGLFLLAIMSFLRERHGLGAAFFCGAAYFKHMSLYYALAIFTFLVTRLFHNLRRDTFLNAMGFAAKVIASIALTTALVFAPWLAERRLLYGVLTRLFPVSRGLYEDKVANVWCSVSIVLKLNRLIERDRLFVFCAVVTVFTSIPFCVAVAQKPSPPRLLMACSGCALSAFLFSYQVHEKQILIPLMPLAILHPVYQGLTTWMSLAATLSLFPLLVREQSATAYVAVVMVHVAILAVCQESWPKEKGAKVLRCGFLAAVLGAVLNLLLFFGTPPRHAPDILVLANTTYACVHLCLIYITLLYNIYGI